MSNWRHSKPDGTALGDDGRSCFKIGPEEYCRLIISARNLVRCDDKANGVRGLEDLNTGERFFIEEANLHEHSVMRARDGLEERRASKSTA